MDLRMDRSPDGGSEEYWARWAGRVLGSDLHLLELVTVVVIHRSTTPQIRSRKVTGLESDSKPLPRGRQGVPWSLESEFQLIFQKSVREQ